MVQGSMPSPGLSVEIAQHSDPGRDPNKQINEDSCGYAKTKFGHLCVLCDGMGGHYGGQEASRRAITTIFEQMEKAPGHLPPATALKLAVEEAGRRVYELGGPPDNKVRPGSTVVAMLLHDAGVDVAHVGDSRAYVIRSNQIYPLTRDHSMVQSMIDAGFLTEEQAIGHPDANKITRALGMKPEVDVEVRPEPMELFPGDVLVQSSDGLTDLALGHEILGALRQALNSGGIEFACQQLVRMANDRGGHDNITVQIARVIATAPKHTRAGQGAPSVSPPAGPSANAGAGSTTVPEAPPTFSGLETIAMGPEGQRPKQTIPMAGAGVSPTTHDASHASAPAFGPPPAPMSPYPAQGPGAAPFAPAHAVSPTLGGDPHAHAQQGLVGYRAEGPQGLALPPPSARYPQGPGYGSPMPPGVQPTPPMTPPPGYGGPQGQPYAPGAASPSWGAEGPMSGPTSQSSRNLLFLWLGLSFFIATAVLIVVYVRVLR